MSQASRRTLHRSKLAAIFIALTGFGLMGCGAKMDDASGQDTLAAEDIEIMRELGGNKVWVKCFDGTSEVRTFDELAQDLVCLNSSGHRPGHGDHHHGDRARGLLCVARDQDGRAPWAIARIRHGQSEIKYDLIFDTIEACEASLRQSRSINSHGQNAQLFLCATRDRDGRNPWSIWSFDDTQTRRVDFEFATFDDCIAGLSPSRVIGGSLYLCSPRDRDGRNPYSLWRLGDDGNFANTSLVYNDLTECSRGLSQSRRSADDLVICASRDSDGRNPYSVFSISASGVHRTQFEFNNFEDCTSAF